MLPILWRQQNPKAEVFVVRFLWRIKQFNCLINTDWSDVSIGELAQIFFLVLIPPIYDAHCETSCFHLSMMLVGRESSDLMN